MSLSLSRPLLIASIGNPGPSYANTLHSAGHTLLEAIRVLLNYPPFSSARGKGLVSSSQHGLHDLTLWQSPTYMNESGPALASAWTVYASQHHGADLAILHDSLDVDLGRARIGRGAGKSAKGHNGLKSILGQRGMGGVDFIRVGVGIGPRPESRDSGVVAGFVLKRMRREEVERVEGLAGEVMAALEKVGSGSGGGVVGRKMRKETR